MRHSATSAIPSWPCAGLLYIALRNAVIGKGDSHGFMALMALVMNAGLNWILGFGLSVASIDRVQRDAVEQTIAPHGHQHRPADEPRYCQLPRLTSP